MLGGVLEPEAYFERVAEIVRSLDIAALETLSRWLHDAWRNEKWVFVCGNGGSAATANHLAQDLAKGVIHEADLRSDRRRGLRSVSLVANISWLTALGNDLGYDQVFVQQLANYGRPGDILIAISGSGNSPNILAAVEWANAHDLKTYGMTGFDGGRLKQIQQAGLHIPLDDMEMVESLHSCVCHWLVDDLRARIYAAGRHAEKEITGD